MNAAAVIKGTLKAATHPKRRTLVNKYLSMLLVVVAFAGASVPAPSQEAKVVVTIPFEFVVGTQTLPGGTYTVSRSSVGTSSPLLLSSRGQSVFLLPTAFDSAESGAAVKFDQVGEEHVLSQIKTPEGIYTIDNHREVEKLNKLAQSNNHNWTKGMAAAGSQ